MNILYPGDCHCENVGLLDALSAQVQVLALDEVIMIKLDINRIFAFYVDCRQSVGDIPTDNPMPHYNS